MENGEMKVALITGCSSGIGHATALALNEAGFHVVATAPPGDAINDLADAGCETMELDVRDDEMCRRAVEAAERHNGYVYAMVNNAGYGQYGPLEEIPLEAIKNDFETNVFGLIRLSQMVLPGMRKAGKGRIINLSSIAGEIKEPGTGVYHATKHAVEAIDGALRNEVEAFGIYVIGIQPGPVDTNFPDVALASIPETGPDSPYKIFKENLKKLYRERFDKESMNLLKPEDVAEKIVEAATDDSPSTRYHVGMMSKVMSVVDKITPDALWDANMQHQIPVDERK